MSGRGGWNRSSVNEDEIERMYVAERRTAEEIASALSVGVGVVYSRLREMGITRSNSASHLGKKPSHYRGGYVEKRSGYRIVIVPKDSPYACMKVMERKSGACYVREHRLVVAQSLGRPLEKWEVVHHINHNKLDNRIENLRLYASQTEHQAETITHSILLKMKKENELMKEIIENCECCRVSLLAKASLE